MRNRSLRCPSTFAMCRPLICGGFVNEYQLLAVPLQKPLKPVIPKFLTSFCSTFLKLKRQLLIESLLLKKYNFSCPLLFSEQITNRGLRDNDIKCIPDKIDHFVALCIGFLHQIFQEFLIANISILLSKR